MSRDIGIDFGVTRDERLGADFRAAEALFANQGMHKVARAFVASHPRAIQYLTQAPVLAMTASPKTMGHRLHSFYQMRIVGPCDRGELLKDVMAVFHLPFPLRRLSGYACEPSLDHVIRSLCRLDPAVLGRIVPEKPGAQRQWMRNLGGWIDRASRRQRLDRLRFEWAAVALSGAKIKKQVAMDLCDFATEPTAPFNEAWGLKRATEEMARWHARLTVERALKDSPIEPETVMDFSRHPDVASVNGFAFIALRTPLSLAEEGAAMRHCVGSYITDVMNGRCSIISIKRGGERVATMEIEKGVLRQLKGPCNADVSEAVWTATRAYVAGPVAEALSPKRKAA